MIYHMQKYGKPTYTKGDAAFDVWLMWLSACTKLRMGGDDVLRLPTIDGRLRLSGNDRPVQNKHNNFEHEKSKDPRYIMLMTEKQKELKWGRRDISVRAVY